MAFLEANKMIWYGAKLEANKSFNPTYLLTLVLVLLLVLVLVVLACRICRHYLRWFHLDSVFHPCKMLQLKNHKPQLDPLIC